MRTNIASYVLESENRKEIVKTLFEYPQRQWSCSALEETTAMPHATVFRTLRGLTHHGLLKSFKINKKDILYELVQESPLREELQHILNLEQRVARKIAARFVAKIQPKSSVSIILYGSSVQGTITPESDIDILVVLEKHNQQQEEEIHRAAAQISSGVNKTVAVTIMTKREIQHEKNSQFLTAVQKQMEVLYGKTPF